MWPIWLTAYANESFRILPFLRSLLFLSLRRIDWRGFEHPLQRLLKDHRMKDDRLVVCLFGHVSTIDVAAQNQTPIASAWSGDAEAPASSDASASRYRGLEDVRLFAVIETPRKFVQIERQIRHTDMW
jgi:hypothetical protein